MRSGWLERPDRATARLNLTEVNAELGSIVDETASPRVSLAQSRI